MIIRNLKYARFVWDNNLKEIIIFNKETGEKVTLDKTYLFSLVRFSIRIFQKLSKKKK